MNKYDKTSLPFLYLIVINKGGKIETDLFYRNTDRKQYLLFNSCHPKHKQNTILNNLVRRTKTILSDDEQMIKRMEELKRFLKRRRRWNKESSYTITKRCKKLSTKSDETVTPFVSSFLLIIQIIPKCFELLTKISIFLTEGKP